MLYKTTILPTSRRTCLSRAIAFALSSGCFMAYGAASLEAGMEEKKVATDDIRAIKFLEDALYAHDGGEISAKAISLSSRSGTLLRATSAGVITLSDVSLGKSFGPLARIENGGQAHLEGIILNSDESFYVSGQGSALSLSHSAPDDTRSTFDISDGASLRLNDVQFNAAPSRTGAALVRGNHNAHIDIQNTALVARDSTVLKIDKQSTARLEKSELSTAPTKDEIGYFSVAWADGQSHFSATETTLKVENKGAGLSVLGGSQASMFDSTIEASNVAAEGFGVYVTGENSQATLQNTAVRIVGAASLPAAAFTGIYAGPGSNIKMTGGTVDTDGNGIDAINVEAGRLHLDNTSLNTRQDDSAGLRLSKASGEMLQSQIMTTGQRSAALVFKHGGEFNIVDSQLAAQNTATIELDGNARSPLFLSLKNSRITTGSRTALRVKEDDELPINNTPEINIIADADTVINGDVVVHPRNESTRFSLGLTGHSVLTGAVDSTTGRVNVNVDTDSLWTVTGNSALENLHHSGTIAVSSLSAGALPGTIVTVRGNYLGNNGWLQLNTVLGGDDSLTDKLRVEGDTRGTTTVAVSNAGGTGAQTLNGIELIHVDGKSEGEFTQQGRIVAGAYDYSLVRGNADKAENWYLVSGQTTPIPEPSPKPATPDTRPESGVYGANLAAANTLFNTRLHDRLGETHYVDAFTGQKQVTSVWMRHLGGHNRSRDSSGQLKTQSNRYVLQLGGDLAQWSSSQNDRFHLGMMTGFARQQNNTRHATTGYRAEGSVKGYSVGVYSSWLQDNTEHTGAYIDSWVQYSWFTNTVKGESLSAERYHSRGVTASVETGYAWKVGEKHARESYYIQPVAQLTWMGVKADDHREHNGTYIQGHGDGNLQTRLGVRAFLNGHNKIDDDKERTFEPFVEANWLHNTASFGASLNAVRIDQAGTRNIGELKAGVEGKVSRGLNVWGNISQQIGSEGYSDTGAMLGIKMNF